MENTISLKEFLDEYGESMAEKVTEELKVIHDPLREREEELEGILQGMTKKPFPSQGEIIKACYKSLTTGNKAVYMVCEMGTGQDAHGNRCCPDAPQVQGNAQGARGMPSPPGA